LNFYIQLIAVMLGFTLATCSPEDVQNPQSTESVTFEKDAGHNGTLTFEDDSIARSATPASLYSRMEIHESATIEDTVYFSLSGGGVNIAEETDPYQLSFILSDSIRSGHGGVFADTAYRLGTLGEADGLLNMLTLTCSPARDGQCREYQSVAGTIELFATEQKFSGTIRASMARTQNGLNADPEFELVATFDTPNVTPMCFALSQSGLDPTHFDPDSDIPNIEVTVPVPNDHPFCMKYLQP
jgi:hypothetical protein